jgi:hypothetical protein
MKKKEVPSIAEVSRKWEDREWAISQLRSHLFEVGFLLEKGDPHFESELADLAMIASHLVDPAKLEERYKKFEAKAKEHDCNTHRTGRSAA